MGDGGFWHNGLITGVASNMFNKGDGVLIVMQNGYASATGQQYLPSSTANRSGTPTGITIENTLRSLGVTWLRTVRTYSVAKMAATLKEAMRTAERGLKVIIADGECMLARQRRVRAEDAEKLNRGERVVKTRYRRRRRDLHRRSFLHPALRMPVIDRQAQSRSAALRSGGDRDRKLRRLRAVRRGRPRRRALPVVLPRRRRQQSELVGPHAQPRARQLRLDGSAALATTLLCREWRGRRGSNLPAQSRSPLTPASPCGQRSAASARRRNSDTSADHPDRRARRRGRRRAHRLDRRRGGEPEFSGAIDLDPGRRAAHRRDHLPHRTGAGAAVRRRRRVRSWRWRRASAMSISWWRAN